ncbi:hypothetical protein AAHZ94_00900 [Streptomyces sp. HSW2009]|uniref:hypothetical protein n=1 Tax=Streptomyces sp. HSW2009 TaxID=3142890 RepID=UPI0032F02669
MARPLRPLVRTSKGRLARGRALVRTAARGATDVLHPVLYLLRGGRALTAIGRQRWAQTPKERRGPAVLLLAAGALLGCRAPYGPLLALLTLMAAAAWAGRAGAAAPPPPTTDEAERLRTLYAALVPHFGAAGAPEPLYAYDGEWQRAFEEYRFAPDGRPVHLALRYPAYFADGDATARGQVEWLLAAKCGRGREYRFDWDEEAGRLTLHALPALPTTRCAQRFVTAPGERVLGFTDPEAVSRTLPVVDLAGRPAGDASPVLWRTGPRSTEPHLLALGGPGSGTTTLLRSLLLQALPEADVLVVDAAGSGGYGWLHGRSGVLAVESDPTGARAALEWVAHETERRLMRAHEARRLGRQAPGDVLRPLWIVVDRPSALGRPATDGRPGAAELLRVPLRHGRPARLTLAIAEQPGALAALGPDVLAHTRARVVLGPLSPQVVHRGLGAPQPTSPMPAVPPGRGFARLGDGPVQRLQVPATPDPYDEATSEDERRAVLALLPGGGQTGTPTEAVPGHGAPSAGPTPGAGERAAGQRPATAH